MTHQGEIPATIGINRVTCAATFAVGVNLAALAEVLGESWPGLVNPHWLGPLDCTRVIHRELPNLRHWRLFFQYQRIKSISRPQPCVGNAPRPATSWYAGSPSRVTKAGDCGCRSSDGVAVPRWVHWKRIAKKPSVRREFGYFKTVRTWFT